MESYNIPRTWILWLPVHWCVVKYRYSFLLAETKNQSSEYPLRKTLGQGFLYENPAFVCDA